MFRLASSLAPSLSLATLYRYTNRCLSKSSDTLVPLFLLIRFTNFYNKRRGRKVKRSRMIDFSKELIYYEFFAFYSLEGILWYIEFFVHIVNFHSIMKMNCLDQF